MLNYLVHYPYARDLTRVDRPAELVVEYRLTVVGDGIDEFCITSVFATSMKQALENVRRQVADRHPTTEKVEIHILRITKVDAKVREHHSTLLNRMA